MARPREIHLFTEDPGFAAAVRALATPLGLTVVDDGAPASGAATVGVLLHFDDESLDAAEAYARARPTEDLVACYEGPPRLAVESLRRMPTVRHLISMGTPRANAELASAYDPGKAPSRNPETTLAGPCQVVHATITQTAARSELLDLLLREAGQIPAFPDFRNLIATAVWELVVNAMYSRPSNDDTGAARLVAVSRTEDIELEKHEAVDVTIARDGDSCAVRVADPFGRLTRDRIIASLAAAHVGEGSKTRDEKSSAGIGLMMVLHSVSRINFFVTPGQRTDIVVVAYPQKRQREYMRQGPTINFFME